MANRLACFSMDKLIILQDELTLFDKDHTTKLYIYAGKYVYETSKDILYYFMPSGEEALAVSRAHFYADNTEINKVFSPKDIIDCVYAQKDKTDELQIRLIQEKEESTKLSEEEIENETANFLMKLKNGFYPISLKDIVRLIDCGVIEA